MPALDQLEVDRRDIGQRALDLRVGRDPFPHLVGELGRDVEHPGPATDPERQVLVRTVQLAPHASASFLFPAAALFLKGTGDHRLEIRQSSNDAASAVP